jgi:DNA-binding transcriptional MerR regulator
VSEPGESRGTRRLGKSDTAFRTIGEVAENLDVPAHVLRFWESKFPQLKPLKRGGGRRYYRPEDIQLLRRIRQCLYQEGYTIRGVQKLLGGADAAENGVSAAETDSPSLFPLEPSRRTATAPLTSRSPRRSAARASKPDLKAALEDIRRELLAARGLLEALWPRHKEP